MLPVLVAARSAPRGVQLHELEVVSADVGVRHELLRVVAEEGHQVFVVVEGARREVFRVGALLERPTVG